MLLAAALLAMALPQTASAGQAGGVSGHVYDSRTKSPMSGMRVLLVNTNTGTSTAVQTDREGFFVDLTGGEGRYVVVVEGQMNDGTHDLYEGCGFGDSHGLSTARVNVDVQWNVRFVCAPKAGLVSSSQTADLYVTPQ